jgi:predicted amidophosphoribosyltransferase
MKYLPLIMTRGPLLAEAMRSSISGNHHLCGYCGTRIPAARQQPVQCPACLRRQRIDVQEDTPWRLTPNAAEALRRSRAWLRRL